MMVLAGMIMKEEKKKKKRKKKKNMVVMMMAVKMDMMMVMVVMMAIVMAAMHHHNEVDMPQFVRNKGLQAYILTIDKGVKSPELLACLRIKCMGGERYLDRVA